MFNKFLISVSHDNVIDIIIYYKVYKFIGIFYEIYIFSF